MYLDSSNLLGFPKELKLKNEFGRTQLRLKDDQEILFSGLSAIGENTLMFVDCYNQSVKTLDVNSGAINEIYAELEPRWDPCNASLLEDANGNQVLVLLEWTRSGSRLCIARKTSAGTFERSREKDFKLETTYVCKRK